MGRSSAVSEKIAQSDAIVEAILLLGKRLDMRVVAEGVETEAQLEHLRRMHCPYVQGYPTGRPMAPETRSHFIVESVPLSGGVLRVRAAIGDLVEKLAGHRFTERLERADLDDEAAGAAGDVFGIPIGQPAWRLDMGEGVADGMFVDDGQAIDRHPGP